MPRRGQDWFVVGLESFPPTSNEETQESLDTEGTVTFQTLEEEELGGGERWAGTRSQVLRPEGPGPALTRPKQTEPRYMNMS